jgi:hypothetical protein
MWAEFDPRLWQDLATFRQMVALKHQTPTKEWPLIYVEGHQALLVVREWPDVFGVSAGQHRIEIAIFRKARGELAGVAVGPVDHPHRSVACVHRTPPVDGRTGYAIVTAAWFGVMLQASRAVVIYRPADGRTADEWPHQ